MAVILPQPPGSFIEFGLDLSGYLAQPGSSFNINRYGFDSGNRRFIVNNDVANLFDFTIGTADFQYPNMFVTKVTQEVVGGPWTLMNVEYLGLLGPKPTQYSFDTDIRVTSLSFVGIGIAYNIVGVRVPEIVIQTNYITATEPDPNQAGQMVAAPVTVDAPTGGTSIGGQLTFPIWLWYWRLDKRAVRVVGIPPGGDNGQNGIPLTFVDIGICTVDNNRHLVGTGTHFLTSLLVGDIVSPTSADAPNQLKKGTLGIASIETDTAATMTVNISGLNASYTGDFQAARVATGPGGGAAALYEVTDTYKRVVILFGEPWEVAGNV